MLASRSFGPERTEVGPTRRIRPLLLRFLARSPARPRRPTNLAALQRACLPSALARELALASADAGRQLVERVD